MIDVSYIEVVGNDATSRRKVAERTVLAKHPGATILSATYFDRGPSGAVVYAVEWKEGEA